MNTWLQNDELIPAYSNCPFRVICWVAKEGNCFHKGLEHESPFSCALARGFASTITWVKYAH